MQEERFANDSGKGVDRARLKEQLHQFHAEQEKMKTKSLGYSPRHGRNNLKMAGSGDNGSTSPVFPVNARVSGKEKRRRVHAWLGSQVGSEDSTSCSGKGAEHSTALKNNGLHAENGSGDHAELGLLTSNSEFIPGNDVSYIPKGSGSQDNGFRKSDIPIRTSNEYLRRTADFSGGGDKYCYVYDPIVARAYTKKYPLSPAERDSLENSNGIQNVYAPASANFTPSPASLRRLEMNTLVNSTDFQPLHPCDDSKLDCSLPTKYEEYDMRPIKPLDDGLKKSLYGEKQDQDADCPPPKPYPRPYLRRSHNSVVSYPTPKPTSSKGRPKTSVTKQHWKIQCNVESNQKRNGTMIPVPVRRSPKDALPKLPTEQKKELPVDLKHVQAATKIQAIWRGYKTRKLNPKVVEIRQELRSRRAEQYISVLCHEVQNLKDRLDTEKKMRDLQTEAIRYIWSQLRMVQKRTGDDKVDDRSRKRADRRPRSKSSSPRRNVKKANAKNPSSQASVLRTNSPRRLSESGALNYDEDSDSADSSDEKAAPPKKIADASWKEVPDEKPVTECKRDQAAEDTDEGRGTLVTDGEGNPAHSSAEEEPGQVKAVDSSLVRKENVKMRETIDVLQEQVMQLQEAMLSMTEKMAPVGFNASEQDELKLASDSQVLQDASVVSPDQKLAEIERIETLQSAPEPALSARGDVPRISLKNALSVLKSALSENELWAICEQAGHFIKNKPVKKYLALENAFLRKDGRVEFKDTTSEEVDDMYLAPEVLDKSRPATVKSSVFSLSVVLWSAADWEMSADEAPQLSDELESLLVDMSQDDVEKRADIDQVILICEDRHAKTRVNSLCVCSSLFAEVEDAMTLAKSGNANRKKLVREISKEQEMAAKKKFKEMVLPDINSEEWRSRLKPASRRTLSSRAPNAQTPHEKLMESIASSETKLKKTSPPKVFGVRDMFVNNPELVHKLNILPGQRRKNQKAMRLVMRRQTPRDPASAPKPGVPTPPRALRAGVSEVANSSGHSSVILRWHPSKMYDKHGQEAKAEKIVGYRIYVNGHPKGMVGGEKSRALLEGLRHSTEYRVHVRAISALGESDASNTVIAHITSHPQLRDAKENADKGVSARMNEEDAEKSEQRKQPKTKPRLGAVFPQPRSAEDPPSKPPKSPSADSKRDNQESGDDVIDRVLRKYGIQQASSVVPGFASGSTLSPMPLGFKSQSTPASSKCSDNRPACGKENPDSKSSSDSRISTDATSKSLELLTQLKCELLS